MKEDNLASALNALPWWRKLWLKYGFQFRLSNRFTGSDD
jgi:hypothetical protein